jgi:hypothetical protein
MNHSAKKAALGRPFLYSLFAGRLTAAPASSHPRASRIILKYLGCFQPIYGTFTIVTN